MPPRSHFQTHATQNKRHMSTEPDENQKNESPDAPDEADYIIPAAEREFCLKAWRELIESEDCDWELPGRFVSSPTGARSDTRMQRAWLPRITRRSMAGRRLTRGEKAPEAHYHYPGQHRDRRTQGSRPKCDQLRSLTRSQSIGRLSRLVNGSRIRYKSWVLASTIELAHGSAPESNFIKRSIF
jgi:hypothetical protein